MEEKINPIRITDNDTGAVYELDFSRESVVFAERRGFKLDDVSDFPVTKLPDFFYLAFRKNHKNISREKTDALFEKMRGMTPKFYNRLQLLYNQAAMSNRLQEDEDLEKNESVTVEL